MHCCLLSQGPQNTEGCAAQFGQKLAFFLFINAEGIACVALFEWAWAGRQYAYRAPGLTFRAWGARGAKGGGGRDAGPREGGSRAGA
jgi:hypothetical protein